MPKSLKLSCFYKKRDFYYENNEPIDKWKDLLEELRLPLFRERWVFRGQLYSWELDTTLERECKNCPGITLNDAPDIEYRMVRDFRRLYDGSAGENVIHNTLYCMSLMRHYGAPSRLMDWTYSYFIAIYFALEYLYDCKEDDCAAIWCLNEDWCLKRAEAIAGKSIIIKRNVKRDENSFKKAYRFPPPKRNLVGVSKRFAFLENPFFIHSRLSRQQGLFLCPNDVSMPFKDILAEMIKNEDKEGEAKNIIKIRFKLGRKAQLEALEELHRMNINRAILFPGLDGFAQSMKYRLKFYKALKI